MHLDPRPAKLLLVEDDPSQAQLIKDTALMLPSRWEVVHHSTGGQALDALDRPDVDYGLALVDLGLPDLGGLDVVRAWRQRYPTAPLLVLSAIAAERTVVEAIRAGADGYLLKDGEAITVARGIDQVLQGQSPISPALARYLFKLAGAPQARTESGLHLTAKERQTLEHLGRGHSYAETGRLMGVSVSTVQTHVRHLYRKLGAHSQTQAVARAREQGLLR